MARRAVAAGTDLPDFRRNVLGSVLGVPWAISPAGLERVLSDVERFLSQAPEAVSAGEEESIDDAWLLRVRDGVGTLRHYGPLVSPSSWLSWYYPSYELLAQELMKARDDDRVQQIALIIDSPGGHVNGCQEYVEILRAVSAVKPVTAFVEGDACSAAYWVAAACRRIVTAQTSVLGCLGAQVAYMDDSKLLEEWGLREVIVTSSQTPLKNRPPTEDEGRAVWQQMVDDIADVFLNGVAAMRGRTREDVDAHFGRGAVLVGARAVSAGLADSVGTYESLHAELVRSPATTAAGAAQLREVSMARRTGRRQATRRTTAAAHEPNSEVRVLVTRDVGVAEGDLGEVVEVRDGSFYRVRLGDEAEYAWLAEDELEAAAASSSDDGADDSADEPADDAEASGDEDEDEDEGATASRRAKPSAFQTALARARTAERKRITGILALAKAAPMAALLKMVEDPKCTPEGAALKLVTGQVKGVNAQALAELAGDEAGVSSIGSIDGDNTPPSEAASIVATLKQHNPRALAASARTTRG